MTELTMKMREELVEKMAMELEDRHYNYTHSALMKIINTWFQRKHNLIELLSKHPLWNPNKFMIQFDTDICRKMDTSIVDEFGYWLKQQTGAFNCGIEAERIWNVCNFIERMDYQYFNPSMKETLDFINSLNENYKLRTNMKASKAINKICQVEGWDKLPDYNKRFALVGDALTPRVITRHTVISVNPMDFLLMSNGNSWHSCHDIDDANDSPGCYSAGTISYMLDEHSFLFYTVDAAYNGDSIETHPKIQRQVFGYNDEVLVQSRLYPQSNDNGADNIYENIRGIVQEVVANCLGKSNLWVKSKQNNHKIIRLGAGASCYPDWHCGNPGAEFVSVSTLKEREKGYEDREIIFGAKAICIECGCEHSYEENINCCGNGWTCSHCGDRITCSDDVYWYNGNAYCYDCVAFCEHCQEYVPYDNATYVGDFYICDYCLENYEECCGCDEYVHHDDAYYDEINEEYYCEHCAERYLTDCHNCGTTSTKDTLYYDEETGFYYCEDCYEELLEERAA